MSKQIFEERSTVQRLKSEGAQELLSSLRGGVEYIQYRKDWDYYAQNRTQSEAPLQIILVTTTHCNLSCKMCSRNQLNSYAEEHMSMNIVNAIAEQAKELNVKSIWLTGGETLIHPEVSAMMRKLSEVGALDYWLVTNGIELTHDISEMLIDIPLTWISVSLDAATEETYKEIRGSDLSMVEKNIHTFLKLREKKKSELPLLRVSFVEMKENLHEKQTFIDKWEDVADIIDFQTLIKYKEDEVDGILDKKKKHPCGNAFRLLTVRPDGEILPCAYSRKDRTGRRSYVLSTTLKEYWNGAGYKEFLKQIQIENYSDDCKRCLKSFQSYS